MYNGTLTDIEEQWEKFSNNLFLGISFGVKRWDIADLMKNAKKHKYTLEVLEDYHTWVEEELEDASVGSYKYVCKKKLKMLDTLIHKLNVIAEAKK